jgi:hypothetical protein
VKRPRQFYPGGPEQLELFPYRLLDTAQQAALSDLKRAAVAVGIEGLNGHRNSLRFARLLFARIPELGAA